MYKNYTLRNSVSTLKKSQCISFDSSLLPWVKQKCSLQAQNFVLNKTLQPIFNKALQKCF